MYVYLLVVLSLRGTKQSYRTKLDRFVPRGDKMALAYNKNEHYVYYLAFLLYAFCIHTLTVPLLLYHNDYISSSSVSSIGSMSSVSSVLGFVLVLRMSSIWK